MWCIHTCEERTITITRAEAAEDGNTGLVAKHADERGEEVIFDSHLLIA